MMNATPSKIAPSTITRRSTSASDIRSGYRTAGRLGLLALASWAILAGSAQAAPGTVMPTPFQTLLDANGNPVSNGKICTYIAGTTTPATTYTDVSLSTPNQNPIRTNSAGRFVVFLSPGASYKFVYQDSTGTAGTCDGALIQSVDNVSAVPASAVNLDVTGTSGEALTAGQVVYLSDGSGGKTAGLWYKADSANTYSSSAAVTVGIVPGNVASVSSGTIRLAGVVTGLTSLTVGTTYYAGAVGALTATVPTNRRGIGIADTTSSLVLNANPASPNADNGVECFRLTLTTGVPVTASDVSAATTVYASPHGCNRIALYDSLGNPTIVTSAEFSLAVPATTATMYDVFAFANPSGVPALEFLAWTNDTTRATAIVLTTTGTYTKFGDLTRRYLGSFRTTAVSGQTEDSAAKRYLWNFYHRVPRTLIRKEATASWTYAAAAWRQANAAAANQVEFVIGVAEVRPSVRVLGAAQQAVLTVWGVAIALGLDSTSAPSGLWSSAAVWDNGGNIGPSPLVAFYDEYPAVGRHFLAWLEYGNAGGNTSFFGNGTPNASPAVQSGITGWIEG